MLFGGGGECGAGARVLTYLRSGSRELIGPVYSKPGQGGGLYLSVMVTNRQRRTSTTKHETAAWRVFAAVPVSAAVREQMRDIQSALAPQGWPMRWVRPELAHLTLRFYGNVASDRVPDLASQIAPVAQAARPLRLEASTIGAFPSEHRPRVIWLGLVGDVKPLEALAGAVTSATSAFGPPERRPFAPHITLARLRDGAAAPSDFRAVVDRITRCAVPFVADRLQLIRSELGLGGPTYTTIHEWQLGALPEIDDHG